MPPGVSQATDVPAPSVVAGVASPSTVYTPPFREKNPPPLMGRTRGRGRGLPKSTVRAATESNSSGSSSGRGSRAYGHYRTSFPHANSSDEYPIKPRQQLVLSEGQGREDGVVDCLRRIVDHLVEHRWRTGTVHTRLKVVLGTLQSRKPRPELLEDLRAQHRVSTEFCASLRQRQVREISELFESSGFVKQETKQRPKRWQVYIKRMTEGSKPSRAFIAHIQHDEHGIKLRKLLKNTEEVTRKQLKLDVLSPSADCFEGRDCRVRVEINELEKSQDVQAWIDNTFVVNGEKDLCPPTPNARHPFCAEVIREKDAKIDTDCGTWKKGDLRLKVQWVEQNVKDLGQQTRSDHGYDPRYEISLSSCSIASLLKLTRQENALPVDVYALAPPLFSLLFSAFGSHNFKLSTNRISDSRKMDLFSAVDNLTKGYSDCSGCYSANSCYAREEMERDSIEASQDSVGAELFSSMAQVVKAQEKKERADKPCYRFQDYDSMSIRHLWSGELGLPSLSPTTHHSWAEARGSKAYTYGLPYFEMRVTRLHDDLRAGIHLGWVATPPDEGNKKIYLYDGVQLLTDGGASAGEGEFLKVGSVLGTEFDFSSGKLSFYRDEALHLEKTVDVAGYSVVPVIRILDADVELQPEVSPPSLGREPTDVEIPGSFAPNTGGSNTGGSNYYYRSDKGYIVTGPSPAHAADFPELNPQYQIPFENLLQPWEEIGSGSFGKVYRCKYKVSADIMAVKELLKEKEMAKFRTEISNLMKFRTPKLILNCSGWAERDGRLYMVTDYCDGGQLREYVDKLPELSATTHERVTLALHAGISVAQALGVIHQQHRMVHLDVAARNVLLCRRGREFDYKLADMGIIKDIGKPVTVFCLPWSPPDVVCAPAKQRVATVGHDWWALGCLMYEVLKDSPYRDLAKDDGEWRGEAEKHLRESKKPTPLEESLRSGLCGELWDYINERLWDLDPVNREGLEGRVIQHLQELRDRQHSDFPTSQSSFFDSSNSYYCDDPLTTCSPEREPHVHAAVLPAAKKPVKSFRSGKRGRN